MPSVVSASEARKPSPPPRPSHNGIALGSSGTAYQNQPEPVQGSASMLRGRLSSHSLADLKSPSSGTPHLPRRRSSILSFNSLEARDFIRPGLGLENEDISQYEEPSHWHSSPLAFAFLPALAGLFFTNGSAFVTDILLLGLAALFLNWSVRLPWYVTM